MDVEAIVSALLFDESEAAGDDDGDGGAAGDAVAGDDVIEVEAVWTLGLSSSSCKCIMRQVPSKIAPCSTTRAGV